MRFENFLNEAKKYKIFEGLKNNLNAEIEYDMFDDVLGQYIGLIVENAAIQIAINEKNNVVYLASLSVKDKEDRTQERKKTGIGTKVVYLIKDYCDKKKKKMVVPESTNQALSYGNKIKFLERDYNIWMNVDGENYNTENTFSYIPRGYKEDS